LKGIENGYRIKNQIIWYLDGNLERNKYRSIINNAKFYFFEPRILLNESGKLGYKSFHLVLDWGPVGLKDGRW
jgi:hypothetical protein